MEHLLAKVKNASGGIGIFNLKIKVTKIKWQIFLKEEYLLICHLQKYNPK